MRVSALAAMVAAFISNVTASANADALSPQLAAIKGLRLFVTPYGEKPCDYIRDRLMADMKFTLNTAGIEFIEGPGDGTSDWPILEAVVDSLQTGGACVWSVEISLSARIYGGNAVGRPYDGYVDLWDTGSFGIHPGNGLTAYVSEGMQAHLRDLVNDVFASKKLYSTQ